MANSTPGPWKAGGFATRGDCAGMRVIVTSPAASFAPVEPVAFSVVNRNADLIAAAPEMLEALRDAITGGFACPEPMLDRMKAVIAKAEGREP